jgi:hypothetical protein
MPWQRRCHLPAALPAQPLRAIITVLGEARVRQGLRLRLRPEIAQRGDAEDRFAAILH